MAEISIGFLSKRTGLAVSALRYYEDIGILFPNRTASGQRRFAKSDLRRVAFVIAAQKFGFTLPEIKSQLDLLPNNRTPTKQDWSVLSQNFRSALTQRIQEMERLRDTLEGCIGCGCLSLTACKLYNPDDQAGEKGPGPQVLFKSTE